MSDSLKLHVQKITKLPTLPVIAQKILSTVEDDMASVDKLERIIENDPAISAKMLSVANSAFFGFKSSARTLNSAIVRIGFSNVKNIALGISLMTVLSDEKHCKALDYQRVFNHSIAVGFAANIIAKTLKMKISDEILMCGMLHDIGFLVLSRYFTEDYGEAMRVFSEGKTLLEAEMQVFGFTHAEIGNWLAEQWVLPDNVSKVILNHHKPSNAEIYAEHVTIVHIADSIVTSNILSATKENPEYTFYPEALDKLGLSHDDLKDMEGRLQDGSLIEGFLH